MDSSTLPLAIAAGAFLAVLVWRVRPAIRFRGRSGSSRDDVNALLAKADAANDDEARAAALCDAADLMPVADARETYLRALRAHPTSVQVVSRAVSGLVKYPRALESVLWRHLASGPWVEAREATAAALDALRLLYEGPRKKAIRAKFFAQARDAMRS